MGGEMGGGFIPLYGLCLHRILADSLFFFLLFRGSLKWIAPYSKQILIKIPYQKCSGHNTI